MLITKSQIHKIRTIVLIVLVLYLMLGAALYLLQERFLFLPTVLEDRYEYRFETPFKELWYHPEPSVRINALYFEVEHPKGVIFYSHGNAGDLSRWGHIAEHFVDYGYDVLVWDYRTYGKSKGPLSEAAIYSDAEYIYNELLKSYNSEAVILYGRSLGTGVASYLASKYEVGQVILETPFYSIVDVARYRFPIFPLKALMKYEFPNFKYLQQSRSPITVFHGTNDAVVPLSSAEKLKNLNVKNLDFITIDGGGHNNLIDYGAFNRKLKNKLQ